MIRIGSKVIYDGVETTVIGRDTGDKETFIIERPNGWALHRGNISMFEKYSKKVYISENLESAKVYAWLVNVRHLRLVGQLQEEVLPDGK